ncbi:MAG TPA: radical SAM protein [bacterium]|nr:radical SAM protein [bacterium]
MRILLVNPPYHPDGYVSGRARGRFLKYVVNLIPPLGLLSLAAVLERDGHAVALHDAALAAAADVVRRARACRPELIGISATTPSLASARAVAGQLRAELPGVRLVLGGAHASAVPGDLANLPEFDLLVRGEGEEPLRALVRGDAPDAVPGVVARAAQGGLVYGPEPQRLTRLDDLPLPAYHLIPPLTAYIPTAASYRALPLATVMTSRGCPAHCTFCDRAVFGQQVRRRSVAHVLAEIDWLVGTHGVREIRFFDDTFTFHPEWVRELCAALAARRPLLPWTCLTRVDRADAALFAQMRAAGCWQVLFGLESGDDAMLARLQKGATVAMNRSAVRMAKTAGFEVRGDFLVGVPGETREMLEATLRFAIEEKLDYAHFNRFEPFPGTVIYHEEYAARGVTFDWNEFRSVQDVEQLFYVPAGMTREQYTAVLRGLLRRFYLRPAYLLQRLTALRTLTQLKGHLCDALDMLEL